MRLIFVYNAKRGKLNAVLDVAHKALRPDTYQCALCTLTHDIFSEKKSWKEYRGRVQNEMQFLHADEFENEYGLSFQYPVILRQVNRTEVVLSADDIGKIGSVGELIAQLEAKTT